MSSSLYTLRREIVEAGRRVYNRNFVAANDGNISARVDAKRVLITPSGVSKGFLKPEDLIVIDCEGKVLAGGGKPSSELFMHLRIYKERPDINGVCHAHPPQSPPPPPQRGFPFPMGSCRKSCPRWAEFHWRSTAPREPRSSLSRF